MYKLFKVLGFIFSWIAPFGVIFVNHVVLEDASWDVDMTGLVIVLILIVSLVRYIDGRVKVWDIQKDHKIFRLNWQHGKRIIMAVMLTWVLYTIEGSIDKIQWSGVLISTSFVIGWILTLLGNLREQKIKGV